MKKTVTFKMSVLSILVCLFISGCSNTNTPRPSSPLDLSVEEMPSIELQSKDSSKMPSKYSSDASSPPSSSPDTTPSTDIFDDLLVGYWAVFFDDPDNLSGFYFAEDSTGLLFHPSEGAFAITSYSYTESELCISFLNMDNDPVELIYKINFVSDNELLISYDENKEYIHNRMLMIAPYNSFGGYTVTQIDGVVVDIEGYQ